MVPQSDRDTEQVDIRRADAAESQAKTGVQKQIELDVRQATKRMKDALDYIYQRLENEELEKDDLEKHLRVLSETVNTWTSWMSTLIRILE